GSRRVAPMTGQVEQRLAGLRQRDRQASGAEQQGGQPGGDSEDQCGANECSGGGQDQGGDQVAVRRPGPCACSGDRKALRWTPLRGESVRTHHATSSILRIPRATPSLAVNSPGWAVIRASVSTRCCSRAASWWATTAV